MTSETTTTQPPFKDLVAELILTTHVPGRHAARNAFAHIESAWKLKDIDPTMATFRAITGRGHGEGSWGQVFNLDILKEPE